MAKMPKGQAKLAAHDIALIRDWIAQGAKTARAEPEDPDAVGITEEEQNFWAFQSIKNPEVPKGAKNPIDCFSIARVEGKGARIFESGGQAHVNSPCNIRPHRTAPLSGGN